MSGKDFFSPPDFNELLPEQDDFGDRMAVAGSPPMDKLEIEAIDLSETQEFEKYLSEDGELDFDKTPLSSPREDEDFENDTPRIQSPQLAIPEVMNGESSEQIIAPPDARVVDGAVIILPMEQSWVHFIKDGFFNDFSVNCLDRLWSKRSPRPYKVKDLPLPAEYLMMTPGHLSVCHVATFRTPWDFHVVFDQNVFNYKLKNNEWESVFRGRQTHEFRTPLELFHGMSKLLWKYREFLDENPGIVPGVGDYETGDLVFTRAVVKSTGGEVQYLGLRAMVLEKIFPRLDDNRELSLLVYCLDTGEDVVVLERNVRPLPRAFIGFPPMAVRCALRGISPTTSDWNYSACLMTRELVKPEDNKKLFAQIFEKNSNANGEPLPPVASTSNVGRVREVRSMDPFLISLKSTFDFEIGAANIAGVLVENRLGICWPPQNDLGDDEEPPSPGLFSDNDDQEVMEILKEGNKS